MTCAWGLWLFPGAHEKPGVRRLGRKARGEESPNSAGQGAS